MSIQFDSNGIFATKGTIELNNEIVRTKNRIVYQDWISEVVK